MKTAAMQKKKPEPVEVHVGSRIRARRQQLGMSQEKLGDALGLTFQQVQKYEKGTNRVGASRLQQIANVLHVRESFFFEGGSERASGKTPDASDELLAFVASKEGAALVQIFGQIKSSKVRRSIVRLVEELTDATPTPRKRAKLRT